MANENNTDKQVTERTPETAVAVNEPDLDVYPLRDPSEDPRWALRVAWTWIIIAMGLFLFFMVLAVLGIWYD